jgi:hypothetical protein
MACIRASSAAALVMCTRLPGMSTSTRACWSTPAMARVIVLAQCPQVMVLICRVSMVSPWWCRDREASHGVKVKRLFCLTLPSCQRSPSAFKEFTMHAATLFFATVAFASAAAFAQPPATAPTTLRHGPLVVTALQAVR